MEESLLQRLLKYYDIDENQYASLIAKKTINDFDSGHNFKDMDKAVDILQDAMTNHDKIMIYGDYDADGIMGISILVKMFSYLDYSVSYYAPNRYEDGYGLNIQKAKEAVSNGVKLMITVDNGVSALEAIRYLKDNGVKVIVLDHHAMPEEIVPADVILHPLYSNYGEVSASGAYVSFMFASAVLKYRDKYLSTLAAISLISDMMPLLDYNRHLLRVVFSLYKDGEFLAIDLLKDGEQFDENSIGMKIAPKINAIGRLIDNSEINKLITYFTSNDESEIRSLYNWINENNEIRKDLSKQATESVSSIDKNEAAIVFVTDCKEGLLGLVANHLCGLKRCPVVAFGHESNNPNILKGSCRAPEGFNVVDAFKEMGDILITYGGHALAGGCSIELKDYDTFKNKFIEFAKNNPPLKVEPQIIPLGLTEINFETYDIINSIGPFGENWKAPLFSIKHIKASSLMYSRSGEHILTTIGAGYRLVGFNFSREMMSKYNFIDAIGKLKTSTYHGYRNLEFNIKEIKENN